MGKQTFIEINGKKYDAATGKQLQSSASSASTVTSISPKQNSGSIDGFSRRKTTARTPANHAAKSTQKSQTLMRKSVKKPDAPSPVNKAENHISKSSLGQQPRRVASARLTTKSPHVQKYGAFAHRSSIIKQHAELPVKQEPSQIHKSQPLARVATATPVISQTTPAQKRKLMTERMIESALDNSQSHEQVHHAPKQLKKRRKSLAKRLGVSTRSMAMSSAALAAVLLAGFFALQNVPNFAMRVAATRAGFDAELPDYKPAGFSFKGPINYSAGKVTVSFRSNSDNRAYDVTQQSSKWNSDALLSNYVVAENKQYQTYQDRGRTLYIYDGSNATWVDNGIWYQIQGESNMTTDQLIRIASSI